MKYKFILLILFTSSNIVQLSAQSVTSAWANWMTGLGILYSKNEGKSIATDPEGNVYSAGEMFYSTSQNSRDIFVSKQNNAGLLSWKLHIGADSNDAAVSIVCDSDFNLLITGYFGDTVDFDPGPGITNLISAGGLDMFVLKLDSAGNFLWVKQIAGNGYEIPTGLSIDTADNIYICGHFNVIADFNPGPINYYMTSNGNQDMFILKLDASGNFVWAQQIGAPLDDVAKSVTTSSNGDVFLTGYFSDSVDFDAGVNSHIMNAANGVQSIFILKLNGNGVFQWAYSFGSSGINAGNSIASDHAGHIVVTGMYSDSCDFDPGVGITQFNATSGSVFISKFDTAGNFVFAKQLGGSMYDVGNQIICDASQNIYCIGNFAGTSNDFDPGTAVYPIYYMSLMDIFLSKLDMNGNFVWGIPMNGPDRDEGKAIALDSMGNVFSTGSFQEIIMFNSSLAGAAGGVLFGNNYFNLTTSDYFIYKLKQCVTIHDTISTSSCDSYIWYGSTYTQSGSYQHILSLSNGCDSIHHLNLFINHSYTGSLTTGACNQYVLNGITYTNSGVYTQTFTNATGCDSTLNLNLSIYSPSSFNTAQIACGSYTLNGSTYTVAGNYTQTLVNSQGCDSIINLTLNFISLDHSVTQTSTSLIANMSGIASYQWVTCPTYSWIAGANNQTIIPPTSGTYAVILTQNTCIDTSACYFVAPLFNEEISTSSPIELQYELESHNYKLISISQMINARIEILNTLGSKVLEYDGLNGTQFDLNLSSLSSGIYFLKLSSKHQSMVFKILK